MVSQANESKSTRLISCTSFSSAAALPCKAVDTMSQVVLDEMYLTQDVLDTHDIAYVRAVVGPGRVKQA